MNYMSKSTEGWAIHGVWLDAAGGILSFTQMAIDAINNGTCPSFTPPQGFDEFSIQMILMES